MTGQWQLVVPETGTNLVTNPSLETGTTGWTAYGAGSALTRSVEQARFGVYSAKVVSNGTDTGGAYTWTIATTTGSHTVSFYLYAATAITVNVQVLDGVTDRGTAACVCAAGRWKLFTLAAVTLTNGSAVAVRFLDSNAGATTFYVDGLQCEAQTYATTYTDGDDGRGVWNGVQHASTSTRPARLRSGGRRRDLDDVYYFTVLSAPGSGLPGFDLDIDDYAAMYGGSYESAWTGPREWELSGMLRATTEATLRSRRAALIAALTPDYLDGQAFRLFYTGGTHEVYIDCRLEGGLDARRTDGYNEAIRLRLVSADPHWYEDNQEVCTLDHSDAITTSDYIWQRKAGVWQAVGAGLAGGSTRARAISVAPNSGVYVGGVFTTAGAVAASEVALWNGSAWSALGAGITGTSVYALVADPAGNLYAGGSFSTAGAVAATSLAKWDGSAWSTIGAITGGTVIVWALALDPLTGDLAVAGNFTTAGGVAASFIAKYDGANWTTYGAGMNDTVRALAFAPDGTLYAAGDFTTAGGVAANRVAKWNGSAWSALGSGITSNPAYTLAVDPRTGALYAGGAFTTAGGIAVTGLAKWNGATWEKVGASGVAGGTGTPVVYGIAQLPDGTMWVGGDFTTVAGVSVNGLGYWNGVTWVKPDITPGGTPIFFALASDAYGTVYVSDDVSNNPTCAGSATATNSGGAPAAPRVIIAAGTNGLAAYWVDNYSQARPELATHGARLYLNMNVEPGEVVTINTQTGAISSSWIYNRARSVFDGSDLTTFRLQPGANTVIAFSNTALTTEYVLLAWQPRWLTLDTE